MESVNPVVRRTRRSQVAKQVRLYMILYEHTMYIFTYLCNYVIF